METLPTVTRFQTAFIWRLFYSLYLLLALVLALAPLYALADFNYQDELWVIAVFILMMIGTTSMGIIAGFYALEILTSTLVLTADRMVYKSLTRKSTMLYVEILGFQADFDASRNSSSFFPKKVIAVVPVVGKDKRSFRMSAYINNHDVLLNWMQENFKELSGRKHIDN